MSAERNVFRIVVAIAGLVPVGAGLLGAIAGSDGFAHSAFDVSLDSHVRYLSGLLLGIGFAIWATLKDPEAYTARYRVLTVIVFLGGLARLYGVVAEGPANLSMTLALVMELVVTPAACLWQGRLARLRGETLEPQRSSSYGSRRTDRSPLPPAMNGEG